MDNGGAACCLDSPMNTPLFAPPLAKVANEIHVSTPENVEIVRDFDGRSEAAGTNEDNRLRSRCPERSPLSLFDRIARGE